ncbi:MAG TPA: 1-deoxy-D-xylulose-5-phosphate synthase, partial [Actinomycetales bacterium]|nr:1-deoxy-D-xylulose-5-phosphate synthase [Actinomycetales bacterium]
EAVAVTDGPTVVRFPKGSVTADVDAVERTADGVDVLHRTSAEGGDVLIVAVGAFGGMSVEVAATLEKEGVSVTVVDPRWVVPVSGDLIELAERHSMVVVVEDGVVHGGVGSLLGDALRASAVDVPMRQAAIPQKFLDHASRGEILDELGLTAGAVAGDVLAWWSDLGGEPGRVEAAGA